MHPKPTQKCILFILLSIYFPTGYFSQLNQDNTTCMEPFQCGSINISYPFWGGSRPPFCGRQGFEIHCEGDIPLLNISSVLYRILKIDFSTHTLKVAREDLWNNTCPSMLRNTTLNSDHFRFSPTANDNNVTLYFNCTSNKQETLPNEFSCHKDGVNTINLFKSGDASSGPGSNITCSNYICIRVNHVVAESLKNPMASHVNVLQAALAGGFTIEWSPVNDTIVCQGCTRSSGTCRHNGTSSACYRQGSSQGTAPRFLVASGSSKPGHSSVPAAIIVGKAVGVTAGIITLSIIIVYLLERRCLHQGSDQDVENILLQHGSLAPKRYKYSEIKKITKSFNDKLGQGGYGTVYKGTLPDSYPVAVKVLIDTNSNGEEFINEVASISRTSHVNIVNLLGFCYERNKRALVYEFMPNKSLDKFISSNAGCKLGLEQLYKIALGVAKGLEYLHTGCNTRIVHFDIKPQNILLDQDFCPKISDFGLAKLCKRKQSILSMLGARGTIGYIAPEIISRNFGGVSHKSDVYSYGMMLLDMVEARNSVQTEAIQSSEDYFPDKIYEEVILDVTRKLDNYSIEEEDNITKKMFLVGFWCIQTIPSDRPSMSKIVEMLEESLHSIQIPPKPLLFSPTLTGQNFSPSLSACEEIENSSGLR